MSTHLYVIKFSNGMYSCGLKKFHPAIRHAQVYVSKTLADQQAKHYIETRDRYTGEMIAPAEEYEIVEITMSELRDTEAMWIKELDNEGEADFICSNCKRSALLNYRGLAVDSKFCSHCGKHMINSTIED